MIHREALDEVVQLAAEYRDRCLWFLDPQFVPTNDEEALRVLDFVERYGDRAAFTRCARLRAWLSQPSKPKS